MRLRRRQEGGNSPVSAGTGWSYGATDAAITAALLAVTVGTCLPWAAEMRRETLRLDAESARVQERCGNVLSSLEALSARRQASSRLRSAATRLAAEVQARPRVAWGDAVGELSRRKPQGVWAVRMTGDAARFRVELEAERPELVREYVQNLSAAPMVEFAGLPAEGTGGGLQVYGRMRGE